MSNPSLILPPAAAERILQGDVAVLENALQRGLNPRICWPGWQMPLLHGICYFLPPAALSMVQAVMDAGVDPTEQHDGLTVHQWNIGGYNAQTGDELGIRLAILKAMHVPERDMALDVLGTIGVRFHSALEWYLSEGISPNLAVEDNWSLLHEAYAKQNAKAAALLLDAGADEKIKTIQARRTPEKLLSSLRKDQREHFLLEVNSHRYHGQASPSLPSPRL